MVPVFMATPTSAWAAPAHRWCRRRTSPPACRAPALADELELGLGRRLGKEIVDARFGGDRRRRQRIVAGDHHGADAHPAQGREAVADAALDDVLEGDHAQQLAVL
jgi:hypothetical protein